MGTGDEDAGKFVPVLRGDFEVNQVAAAEQAIRDLHAWSPEAAKRFLVEGGWDRFIRKEILRRLPTDAWECATVRCIDLLGDVATAADVLVAGAGCSLGALSTHLLRGNSPWSWEEIRDELGKRVAALNIDWKRFSRDYLPKLPPDEWATYSAYHTVCTSRSSYCELTDADRERLAWEENEDLAAFLDHDFDADPGPVPRLSDAHV